MFFANFVFHASVAPSRLVIPLFSIEKDLWFGSRLGVRCLHRADRHTLDVDGHARDVRSIYFMNRHARAKTESAVSSSITLQRMQNIITRDVHCQQHRACTTVETTALARSFETNRLSALRGGLGKIERMQDPS